MTERVQIMQPTSYMGGRVSITRNNPTCVLFIIDQSSSMAQEFGERGEGVTKADAVARTLNDLLRNLIITCTKSEGVRHYFDVGVIGYGERVGAAWSGPLYGRELVSIRDVAQFYTRTEERMQAVTDIQGVVSERSTPIPVWIESVAKGSTLMCQGLELARNVLQGWILRNQTAYPPVIVHITDGEATDGDPAELMASIARMQTSAGSVSLFNVHLSSSREASPLFFPESPDNLPDNFSRTLFLTASYLTEYMRSVAWDNGMTPSQSARAFVMNADPSLLALAMDIGTRAGYVR